MKIMDQVLGIPSEAATQENPHYVRYRKSMHYLEAGAVLLLGGLVANATGVDVGEVANVEVAEVASDVAMGVGFAISYFSVFPVVEGVIDLQQHS